MNNYTNGCTRHGNNICFCNNANCIHVIKPFEFCTYLSVYTRTCVFYWSVLMSSERFSTYEMIVGFWD